MFTVRRISRPNYFGPSIFVSDDVSRLCNAIFYLDSFGVFG